MKYKKFKLLLSIAKMFQDINPDRADFWRGFQRGISRLYHGEKFGTSNEHEKWMNCADGEHRKELQLGYRMAYYYDDLKLGSPDIKLNSSKDIRPLRKMLLWTVVDVAEITAVSPRTVEGWEQGRPISNSALSLLREFLMI